MTKRKDLQPLLSAIKEAGAEILSVEQGKHYKVKCQFNGRMEQFTFAVSLSDGRGRINALADIRRRLR